MEKVTKCLDKLEQSLKEAKDGFLLGSKITIADIQLFEECNTLSFVKPDAFDSHPRVKAWHESIQKMEPFNGTSAKGREATAAFL